MVMFLWKGIALPRCPLSLLETCQWTQTNTDMAQVWHTEPSGCQEGRQGIGLLLQVSKLTAHNALASAWVYLRFQRVDGTQTQL